MSAILSRTHNFQRRCAAPREVSAIATVTERYDAVLPRLITSSDFEADYDAAIASFTEVADWHPIYEELERRWEIVDERQWCRALPTVTR